MWFSKEVIFSIISSSVLGILTIIFINPYKEYFNVYKKILKVQRDYKDPREYFSMLGGESFGIKSISNQIDKIKEIIDIIEEKEQCNKFIYKFFNYSKIKVQLHFLIEYIRNPIMLPEDREFENDYLLNEKMYFDEQTNILNTTRFRIIITPVIFLVIIVIVYFVKFSKY